jgi:uncharacterized protein
VKVDDLGVWLAMRQGQGVLVPPIRALGRAMVKAMPVLLSGLGMVGVAAMLWVGGGIIAHGLEVHGLPQIAALLHGAQGVSHWVSPPAAALAGFVGEALATSVFGLGVGVLLIPLGHVLMPLARRLRRVTPV